MPSLASIQLIDDYWSSFLGCQIDDIYNSHTLVIPHAGLGDYWGVLLFRRGPSCIISVPAMLAEATARKVGERDPNDVFSPSFLRRLFGDAVKHIAGPAWLGYADATDFHPPEELQEARRLTSLDEPALKRMAAACDDGEWEQSGIDLERPPIFGAFSSAQLVAAGSAEHHAARLLHAAVITHPAYRGRGYGRAVVSAMTRDGIKHGNIMQYRTLYSNAPALSLARSLGYHEYAATLAVRLYQRQS